MRPNVLSIACGDHRARVLAARNARVEAHLDLVGQIAEKIHRKLPPSFDLDDCISTGYLGLIYAANAYRPDFPSEKINARPFMPFSAYARKKIRGAILDSVKRRHYEETTRPPIPIAVAVGLRAPLGAAVDPLVNQRVRLALADLPARLQGIVVLHYFEGIDLKVIASEMGLTAGRVRQLRADALAALGARLSDVA